MANSQDIKNMLEEFLSDLKGELYDVRSDAMRDAMVQRTSATTSKSANVKSGIDIKEQSEAFFNQLVQAYNSKDPFGKIKGNTMGSVLNKLESRTNIPDGLYEKTVEAYVAKLSSAFENGIKQFSPDLQQKYAGKFQALMSSVGGDVAPDYAVHKIMSRISGTLGQYERYMDKAYSPIISGNKGIDLSKAIMSTPTGSIYHKNNRGVMSAQNTAVVNEVNKMQKQYKDAFIDVTNRGLSQYNTSASAMAKRAQSLYKTKGKNAGQIKTDNLGYYDFETVGTVGNKDFGITEMSVYNAATGKMMNSFFQLSQDASTAIANTIKSIESGEKVSKDAMMHALRMADYTTEYINGTAKIVAKHTSTKPGSFIDTSTKTGQALVQKMKSGLDIMSGKTAGVSNLVKLPDKIDHWQGHSQSVQKIFNDLFGSKEFTLGSNNGMGFDDSILRQLAPNLNFKSLDILDLVKAITPKGSYNKETGKMLARQTLSGIADWVGVKTGGAHTGANDVKVGSEAMLKYLSMDGIREKIEAMAKQDAINLKNIKGQIFMAQSGYTRASEFGHLIEKGTLHKSTSTSDKFDWKDSPITKGSFWKVNGRFSDDVTGRMFTELENVLTGDIYREDQTDEQFQKMINQITHGDFEKSRISESDIIKKIPEALAEMAGTPYAWNMFEKILGVKTNKDGSRSLSANNKNALFGLNNDLFKDLQSVWKTISDEATVSNLTDVDKSRILNMALGSNNFNIRKVSGATSNPLRSLESLKGFLLEAAANGGIDLNYLSKLGYDDIRSLTKSMNLSGEDNDIELSSMYSIANNLLTDSFKDGYTKQGISDITNIKQSVSKAIEVVKKRTANVKDGKSVLGKRIYDIASKDMRHSLTSGYLNTKYKNKNPNVSYSKSGVFSKTSPLGSLDYIAEMASKQGVGLLTNYDDATGLISLGVYDPTVVNPETIDGYDWSQVARIDMPTVRPDGTYQYRGMKHANIGETFLDENGAVNVRGIPEIAWSTLTDMFTPRDYKNGKTPSSLAQNIFSTGGADKFAAFANAKVADSIDFTSAIGNTGIKNELASYERAGGSIEQTLFRNSLITDRRLFEQILSLSDVGKDIIDSGEAYKINPYLNTLGKAFNLVSHGGMESLNEYRNLPEAEFITDEMAAKLKERAIKFGNDKGAVKEEAKLNYINGSGIDPHYYLPFGWAYAPGDRAPSQIENDRELTESAKERRRKDLNSNSPTRAYRRHFRTQNAADMISQYRTPDGNAISAYDYYNDPRMFMYRMYSDENVAKGLSLTDETFALKQGMQDRLESENRKNKIISAKALDRLRRRKDFNIKNWDNLLNGQPGEYRLESDNGNGYEVKRDIFGDSNNYSLFTKGDVIDSITPLSDGTFRLNGRTIFSDNDAERKMVGTRGRGTQSGTFKYGSKNIKLSKADAQGAAILSGNIKANARNLGTLVDGKMEYVASLIDEHIESGLQQGAYNKFASILNKTLGNTYTVGGNEQDGFYISENTDGVDWTKQAKGLAKVSTGFYGGDDWFKGLAKDLGLEDKYNPNLSNVWLRNTNQTKNSEVGERVKWGIKSEKSVKSVMQMAGMQEEIREEFLSKLYENIGYGDNDIQKNAEMDAKNIEDTLRNTLTPSNFDRGNYLRIVSDSVWDTLSKEEQNTAVKASKYTSDLTTLSKGKRAGLSGLEALQKKISDDGYDGAYVDMGPDYGAINYRDGQYGESDNAMGARRIGLTDFSNQHLQSYLTEGGKVPNWILEQAKLINSVADMDVGPYAAQMAVDQAGTVIETLTNAIGNKDGEVWDSQYNKRVKNSAQLSAVAMDSDTFQKNAKFLANKGIVHQNVIKSMLGDLSEDELIAELKKAYKATGQTYNKKTTGNLSKSDLIKKIVKSTDFATYGSKAYSIQSMLSRVPFISRFGELFGGLITHSGDDSVSEGSIRLASSLAGFEHGDFDGDTFRAIAASLGADGGYVEQFSKLEALTQEGVLWYEYLSGAMDEKSDVDNAKISNKDAEAKAKKDIDSIMDPKKAAVINAASKFNKEYVSTNSLLNTGLRNAVAKYYTGANPDTQHLFNGLMAELPSKILEQDPISAKKMIENVQKGNDAEIGKQIAAFKNINEARENISYAKGNASTRYDKFFQTMHDANLIDADGYFSGGSVTEMLAAMLQGQFGDEFDGMFDGGDGSSKVNITKAGKAKLKDYFGQRLKSLGFDTNDTAVEEYINNMMQARVHENIIKRSTADVDKSVMRGADTGGQGIYAVGSWGRSKDYWSKTSKENALYGAARVLGIKPEKTELYHSAKQVDFAESLKEINGGFTHKTSAVDGTVDALNAATEAQNLETKAEQAKIPIAKQEAAEMRGLAAGINETANAAKNIDPNGIKGLGDAAGQATQGVTSLNNALGLIGGGKSFAAYKGKSFEYDHQYQYKDTNGKLVDYKGNTSTGLAGRAKDPLNMQDTQMQKIINDFEDYKRGDSSNFNNYDLKTRSMVASTIRGNYVHKQMELLGQARNDINESKIDGRIKKSLMSKYSIEDIIKTLEQDKYSSNNLAQELLGKIKGRQSIANDTLNSYKQDLDLIFSDTEDGTKSSYMSTAQTMNKNFANYLIKNGLELFDVERTMGVRGDSPFIATLDTLSTDKDGNWVVGDWKTTSGAPNVKEYLQLQNNMKAVRALLSDIRTMSDEGKTEEEIVKKLQDDYDYSDIQAKKLYEGRNKNVRGTLQHSFAHIDNKGAVTTEGYTEYGATTIPEEIFDRIVSGLSRGEVIDDNLLKTIEKKGFYRDKSLNDKAVRADMYDALSYKMKGKDTFGVDSKMEGFKGAILGLGEDSEKASGLKNSIKQYFDAKEKLDADALLPEGERMSKDERAEWTRKKDASYSAVTAARQEVEQTDLAGDSANKNAQNLANVYREILKVFAEINMEAAKRTTSEQEYISLAQQDAKLQEQIAAAKASGHSNAYISELEQRLALLRQLRSEMVGGGAVSGDTAATIDEQIAGITLGTDGKATVVDNETSDAIKTKGDIAGKTESAKNVVGGIKAETQAEEAFYNLIEKEILLLEKRAQLLEAARLKKGSDLTTDEAAKVTSDIDQAISNLQRMRQALKDESAKNKDANAELEARENFVKQEEERLNKGKSKAESKGQAAAVVAYATTAESEREAEAKKAQAELERAMKSGIGGQTNYNTAELNMIRAQKALEKARASGNAEAILGAEQQLEGARQAAEIADQHRGQFALYDKDGKQLKITDDKGRYLSDAEIRKQAGGEYKGAFSYYNQETGQMDTKAMGYKEAHDYLDKMTILQGKLMQAVGKTNAQVKTMGSLIGEVLGGMKQTIQYLMRTSIVYAIIGKVKQAFATLIQTVQGLNKSYVDLRIASGQTDSQMKDSLKVYNQMAKEMGKTTQEVAAAANDWLRAGYDAEESAKLIKNSMQLSTVGMMDAAKATEVLISTKKGWKLATDDMQGVVDKLTELDRNAAITAGDLAEAMSRANVSAQMAGSELNKYMSYITTVSDVSQLAPESVGTAFKTLYSRFGNVKAGKFVAGAGDESNGEEFEALNDIERVLNKIGISMRDTSAEFRNFDDVLAEIAEKWVTLSDVERNAISTAFAGTRQREVLILRTGIQKYVQK